ncbi:MAG: tetratricopeptide repeat protein [Candidatus Aminicenantales bacterium]
MSVRLVVDRAIPNLNEWRFRANDFLEGATRLFKAQFGIRLSIEGPERWQPKQERRTLEDALVELRTTVRPEGRDIVFGVIDPGRLKSPALGIASYPHAYILLSDVPNVSAMKYAFLHELCHVFGAIDLKEKGSVMGVVEPSLEIDRFTSEIVLLNRDRSFARTAFPLAGSTIDAAIEHYKDRAGLRRGEPQTLLFLTLLYLEKNDIEAAAEACDAAAKTNPGTAGLHILLGNIRLRRGQVDQAVEEYKAALGLQPSEPGVHFDLCLAYIQARLYKDAAEECRAALEINADYVRARLTLARLLLATGSSEAAATECRAALKSDPRSAEALCIWGTAMVALRRPFFPLSGAQQEAGRDAANAIAPGSPQAEQAVLDAIPLLQKSIALDPSSPEPHVSLGSAYLALKEYPQAESEFQSALTIEPNGVDAHYELGSLYIETGQVRKAAFHLERIMTIDPTSELGSRMIARAYSIQRTYAFVAPKPDK